MTDALHPSTVAIHAGRGPRAADAPLNPPSGAKVVGPATGYAWTSSLFRERAESGRINLISVSTSDTDATLRACADADRLERPSNP